MEVLVNDLGTASFTYTAPQNTTNIVYSVYDNTNDAYIQYEEVDFTPDTGTVSTISIASPAVITQANHTYVTGDAIKFSTTGALPTGINTTTTYYVLKTSSSQFNIYTTSPTSLVNTSGAQSGVHKVLKQGRTSYTISLNSDICKYDRSLLIDIQSIQVNGYSTDNIDILVKRPYATVSEIKSYFLNNFNGTASILANQTDAFIQKLERKARYLINAYTGNEFKFEYKTVGAYGLNTDLLYLGQRIESFDKIIFDDFLIYDSTEEPTVDLLDVTLGIAPSKFSIRVVAEGVNITEWVDQNPLQNPSYFGKDSAYLVRGEYGWKAVPEDIKIAVYELINDFLCNDFIYRNKGLKSIQNDSFNIQFADGMLNGTGNLYVDSLLSQYKVWNLKAI
ncbi:MAG: hypothetical protein EB127_21135, partial [Alphaproteobacteria bacterium]|nr:hypothetical protein [Alphaproteobacteria bacterium]